MAVEHGNRVAGHDVRAALQACTTAAPAWAERSSAERAGVLRVAAAWLEEDHVGAELCAAALGAEVGEILPHLRGCRELVESRLPPPESAEGIVVLHLEWTELARGILLRAVDALGAGRAVLLFSDPRLPLVADRVALALEHGGLPAGAFAVVHGAGDDALATALDVPAVRALVASGTQRRIEALRRLAESREGDGEVVLELEVPVNATVEVEAGVDVGGVAAEIVDGAFGRARTLSGQLPGRLGLVQCDPRVLPELTAALLAALDENDDVQDPIPLIDREAVREIQAVWRLGLDEGATLIAGGDAMGSTAGERRVLSTVFTNVEPGMQLADTLAPGPLLCLLRGPEPEQP
ncbi:MAG: aldehyde dehydrogenase family protein [Planctomycetota bacterium]|nr:aldehyde dehydrogenase family protein [Planctomycetota bacterium]